MLESGDAVQHLDLHLLGHRGREALDVQLLGVQPHRLDEQLMARLVGKGHHLCLDAGAVARADALDNAGIYRAAVEICADYLVRALVGVGQVAHGGVARRIDRRERERLDLLVAPLKLHL